MTLFTCILIGINVSIAWITYLLMGDRFDG